RHALATRRLTAFSAPSRRFGRANPARFENALLPTRLPVVSLLQDPLTFLVDRAPSTNPNSRHPVLPLQDPVVDFELPLFRDHASIFDVLSTVTFGTPSPARLLKQLLPTSTGRPGENNENAFALRPPHIEPKHFARL